MQRLILAHALPTNVVHGFLRWVGVDNGTTNAAGDPSRCSMSGSTQSFQRPDMGVADALNR